MLVEIYLEGTSKIETDYHELREFNPKLNTLLTVDEFIYKGVTYSVKDFKLSDDYLTHIVKAEKM
ncbi:hypothetical protein [Lysinibacillus sphaericus]|uniref:hypothetical protein n=1 Tax=Lysinibacillus sphaericus TaxID=1421 RepID=UPI003D70B0E4